MYYSSGNYEAFARPRRPERAERVSAWFVGAGLASLAGAAFLVRDAQVPGERITILERLKLPGGALDGIKEPAKGFVIRGGRELEDHVTPPRRKRRGFSLSRVGLATDQPGP
ncbi:oleate hydratase [Kitasatospora sp. NPDC058965]|uniref:oleate hydratase n=1 Tax=Kitasatospora sp. NPDC058965 TaxID=3346682 RepID=UPI0036764DC4